MKDNKKHWKAAKEYGIYPESKEPEKDCSEIAEKVIREYHKTGCIDSVTQALEREREKVEAYEGVIASCQTTISSNKRQWYEAESKLVEATELIERLRDALKPFVSLWNSKNKLTKFIVKVGSGWASQEAEIRDEVFEFSKEVLNQANKYLQANEFREEK